MKGSRSTALLVAVIAGAMAPAVARADAPAGEATASASASPSARFKGSILILDQSTTPDTVFQGSQQSAIPSYEWWFSFRPRLALPHNFQFRGRLDLTLEWLNAADTTHAREPRWGDLWTDVVYTGIPKVWGVQSTVGVRALWPLSLESRMATNIVTLGLTAGAKREFETKIGDFELTLGLAGSHAFQSSTSGAVIDSSYGCVSADFAPQLCSQNTGRMNSAFNLVASFGGKYAPTKKLSLGASYIVLDNWAYATPDVTLMDRIGGKTVVEHSVEDQRLRTSGWFIASVDYDLKDWVSLSLGYYVYRGLLNPDGSFGNPFYAPGGATRIFLSTTLALDSLYDAIALKVKKN